jgi:hypothetical protein
MVLNGEAPMRYRLIATLIAVCVALVSAPAAAASSLQGQWRGSGVVHYGKKSDAVRCRVSFQKLSASAFSVSSQCATETGHYNAAGRGVASGSNRYSGRVEGEGVTGTVTIVQSGSRLSVTVSSQRGSAKLSLSKL